MNLSFTVVTSEVGLFIKLTVKFILKKAPTYDQTDFKVVHFRISEFSHLILNFNVNIVYLV
jgi:hypothetical protein